MKEQYINFDEYIRHVKAVEYSPVYLERFFRNLLLGEQWDLRNRYLHIHPTKDWSEQPNLTTRTSTHTSTRTSTRQVPEQVQDLLHTSNPLIIKLIMVIGNEELSVSQLMERTGLKHRPNFIEYHLNPAIAEGYVRLLYPLSPRHPRQEYHLSEWRRHSILRLCHRWPHMVHEEETDQGR